MLILNQILPYPLTYVILDAGEMPLHKQPGTFGYQLLNGFKTQGFFTKAGNTI